MMDLVDKNLRKALLKGKPPEVVLRYLKMRYKIIMDPSAIKNRYGRLKEHLLKKEAHARNTINVRRLV